MKEKIIRITEDNGYPETLIEKTVSVNYDGKQFFIRIPKEISDYFKLKKKDSVKFIINISYIEETKEKIMVVKIGGK